jgi:hypothetical protein
MPSCPVSTSFNLLKIFTVTAEEDAAVLNEMILATTITLLVLTTVLSWVLPYAESSYAD